jgi:hypothetical protein
MDNIPTAAGRWGLRCDAEVHRDVLLDALSFIGAAIQDCTTTSTPHPFSQADLHRLSGFLLCAPALIRGMNAVIEAYEVPAADHQEARHV